MLKPHFPTPKSLQDLEYIDHMFDFDWYKSKTEDIVVWCDKKGETCDVHRTSTSWTTTKMVQAVLARWEELNKDKLTEKDLEVGRVYESRENNCKYVLTDNGPCTLSMLHITVCGFSATSYTKSYFLKNFEKTTTKYIPVQTA